VLQLKGLVDAARGLWQLFELPLRLAAHCRGARLEIVARGVARRETRRRDRDGDQGHSDEDCPHIGHGASIGPRERPLS
jgi:hypothetical protein